MGKGGYRLRKRVLITLVLIAGLLLAAPAAHAAFPGQNGKIAYVDGREAISVMNPDGSGQQEVTFSIAEQWAPDWSPDGQRIALGYNENSEVFGIAVVNADGSGFTLVYDGGGADPTWSPDGRRIAFSDCGIQVIRYPYDGAFPVQLTPCIGGVHDWDPEWSPAGDRIAFSSNRDGNHEIYTMNAADGSNVQRVTNSAGDDFEPDWSPDGSRLVFTKHTGHPLSPDKSIYSVRPDRTALQQLAAGPADFTPMWSPDGRRIGFARSYNFHTMNPDGTGVVATGAYIQNGDWQPILHDAPQSADTLHMSLVPMFRQTISSSQCAARGGQTSTHGAPLAFSSCNPPGYLPNTMARLGPSSSSSVEVTGVPGDPATSADEADLTFNVSANDVRARPGGGDYDPSASPDATLSLILRWSDTYNGPALRAPATGSDLTYSVPVSCVSTADPSLGSNCSTNTTADALAPGTILEGRRTVITLSRWWLYDSGLNATRGNADDRMFAHSGIYLP